MTSLQDQLAAFAASRGGVLRHGPQPLKPKAATSASIGPSENPGHLKPKADTQTARDAWIDYTDDYSLWCRTRRGE